MAGNNSIQFLRGTSSKVNNLDKSTLLPGQPCVDLNTGELYIGNGSGAKKVTQVVAEALSNHTRNTSNPHKVTKSQVGLSLVANERQYSVSNPPPSLFNKNSIKTFISSNETQRFYGYYLVGVKLNFYVGSTPQSYSLLLSNIEHKDISIGSPMGNFRISSNKGYLDIINVPSDTSIDVVGLDLNI